MSAVAGQPPLPYSNGIPNPSDKHASTAAAGSEDTDMNETAEDDTVLWKNVVDIPDAQDTFVLKLSDGIDARRQTVDRYVVTDSLARRFDQALGIIEDGLAVGRPGGKESQGAYLHGSFGAGKSHFMAMLNLVLDGYGPARDKDGLRDIVADHGWMDDTNLLMLPFHMLDRDSMEQAVLGGYVEYIQEHHPDASLPGVFVADDVIANADELRETLGDEAFFEKINDSTSSNGDGWGEYAAPDWDPDTYEEVKELPATADEKHKLVGAIVDNLLTAVPNAAKADKEGGGYVDFDEGLSIISKHARGLGYDGLLFFLDELILWLSRRAAQPEFVSREAQKISKLVEAQNTDRPAPIFSFVARQRDLSEMIGDEYIGEANKQLALHEESIKGRFHVVELEDRNLPAVAQARLLRPRDKKAEVLIDESFEDKMEELTDVERDIMLTGEHDQEEFRKVYPFSPALVEALIVLSNELQRSRTALKIMQLLLIRRRDRLKLGDLIPVGDLWSVLSEGDEPSNAVKKRLFEKAREVDKHQIQPRLREEHEVESLEALDPSDPEQRQKRQDYINDQRLLHTLLVAALVQEMPMFETVTPERLVALNHGTVQSFVPEAAADQIKPKLRRWSVEINPFHMTQGRNPEVELRLEGVEIEPLIEKANQQDSFGARVQRMRRMIYDAFDAEVERTQNLEWALDWKGDTRKVDVRFANVRELPFRKLEPADDRWLIIVDYPFDRGDHTPKSDEIHLNDYREERGEQAETIVWLPRFLNDKGRKLLGKLVKIESVLNQFDSYAKDLRADDRPVARRQLKNARDAILDQLKIAVRAAYGLGSQNRDLLAAKTDVPILQSLASNFDPSKPQHGKSFDEALEAIVREALNFKYPNAPRLPDERLTPGQVAEMHDVIRAAVNTEEESAHVDKRTVRKRLRRYGERLELGVMGDNRFELKYTWPNRVQQKVDVDEEVEVGVIYQLIDSPDNPTGLAKPLKDLIVLAIADMEDMVVRRQGQPLDRPPGQLKASDRLVASRLPSEKDWETTKEVADRVFGVHRLEMLHSRNVQGLVDQLREAAAVRLSEGRQIANRISQAADHFGLDEKEASNTRRWIVARKLRQLLMAFEESEPTDVVEKIGSVDLEGDIGPVARSWESAADNLKLLEAMEWKVFDHVVDQGDEANAAARALVRKARKVLSEPEHSSQLDQLENIQEDLLELVMDTGGGGDDTGGGGGGETETLFTVETTVASAAEKVSSWLQENFDDEDDREVTVTIEVAEETD